MSRSKSVLALLVACAALGGSAAVLADAGQACRADAMIVFDGSGSMSLADANGRERIQVARESVAEVLPEVTHLRRTGLVVYGTAGACFAEVKLRPRLDAAPLISKMLDETPAGGATPLGRAVETAVQVLGGGEAPGVVVVVTDGEDNCGVDPCDLGGRLKVSAPKTVVHIIGFMMGERHAVHAACLADATNGLYVPARTFEELKAALREALGCPRLSAPAAVPRRRA